MAKEVAASRSPSLPAKRNLGNQFLKILTLNNMSPKWSDVKSESEAFTAAVCEIEAWWQSDRQKHIKRYIALNWSESKC